MSILTFGKFVAIDANCALLFGSWFVWWSGSYASRLKSENCLQERGSHSLIEQWTVWNRAFRGKYCGCPLWHCWFNVRWMGPIQSGLIYEIRHGQPSLGRMLWTGSYGPRIFYDACSLTPCYVSELTRMVETDVIFFWSNGFMIRWAKLKHFDSSC